MKVRFSSTLRGWFALALVAFRIPAQAHDPGLSTLSITLYSDHTETSIILSRTDAAILLDTLENRSESTDKTKPAPGLARFAGGSLEFKPDGQIVAPRAIHCASDNSGNITCLLNFACAPRSTLTVRSKWLTALSPGHRTFLSLQTANGEKLGERLLGANDDSASFEISAATNAAPPAAGTPFASFLKMGVVHIWTGYDHLLFLFGLLAVARNVRAVLKIITCFTVAHSITLCVASLNLLTLPSRIVEPMIAASIVVVGAENFLSRGEPKGRWLLTFGFGLIHGFGFASALREVAVGEHGSGIVWPLISFNSGVELGQIAVASLALPLIWKLRNYPALAPRWLPVTSSLVAATGLYWFTARITG